MKTNLDILLWPVQLGLAPVRKLGETARQLASSTELAERLQADSELTMRERDVFTALTLAQVLKGRLNNGQELEELERRRMEKQLSETAEHIGHMIIEAGGSFEVNSHFMRNQQTSPEL